MTRATLPRSERRALAGLALCVLLPSLAMSIANVALPSIAGAFDASFGEVQAVVLAYVVANTVFMVFAGKLGDVAGRRRVLAAGAWTFAIAGALSAAAPTLGSLDAARALQGMGAAVMIALAMALVADTVPKERTGRAMGLLGSMSAIGTALGPSLGGFLTAFLGWRAVFVVTVPPALIALHLLGPAAPDAGLPGSRSARAVASPAAEPGLAAALAMSALVASVMMTTLLVGPFYLARTLGLDIAMVGLVMSAGPVVAALSGVPSGRLVDRFGASRTAPYALAGMIAGSAGLALAPIGWGVYGYLLPLAVLTAHYALFQAANNTAVMKDVARDRRGAVSGALNLARNAGFIAGASAMGAVFARAGMGVTFAAAAGLTGVALAIAVADAMTRRRALA